MFRLLGLAALIAAAWALWRRQPQTGGAVRVSNTRVKIVIEGTPDAPRIKEPVADMSATFNEPVFWEVVNQSGAPQDICLVQFIRKGTPAKVPPLVKSDPQRCDHVVTTRVIPDTVRPQGDAEVGLYKYNINLNGKLALDPDLEIWV